MHVLGTFWAQFRHNYGTLYAHLKHGWACFWEIAKNNEFQGRVVGITGREETNGFRKSFSFREVRFEYVFRLQLQLNLQLKKLDSSLLRTTLQAGCHKTAYVAGKCFHFGFMHCNQARDRVKSSFTCSKDVFNSIRK